jgi:hypothetical protein
MSYEIRAELANYHSIIHDGDRHFPFVRDATFAKLNLEGIRVDTLSEPEAKPPVHGQKCPNDLTRKRTKQKLMPGRGIPFSFSRVLRVQNRLPRATKVAARIAITDENHVIVRTTASPKQLKPE